MRRRIPLSPLTSVILFALLCATTAHWAMILLSSEAPVAPAPPLSALTGPADAARTASLFGPAPTVAATPAAAAAPVNIRILGVMARAAERTGSRPGAMGVALVSIDGQAARPYTVGDILPNGMRVESIRKDAVEFMDQGRLLSAPAPRESDTTVLVRGAAPGSGSPAAAPVVNPAAPRTFGAQVPSAPPLPQAGSNSATSAPPPPAPPAQAGDQQSDTRSER